MIRRLGRTLLAAALAVASSGCRPAQRTLVAGDLAPEFALPGTDGKTHRLSSYQGRVVVLAWFPKTFTGG